MAHFLKILSVCVQLTEVKFTSQYLYQFCKIWCYYNVRLSSLFVGLHFSPHFDFGKSKKNEEINLCKCYQDMTKILPYIVFRKQWSFKMIKSEISAHYLVFWTQIYNFLAVQVIKTYYISNVTIILYILGLRSIFYFYCFFLIAAL